MLFCRQFFGLFWEEFVLSLDFLGGSLGMLHKDPKNRETFCNPEDRYETADWIEGLFYDKKD